MVQEAIEKHEIKVTNEILDNKNRTKLWNHISKLRRDNGGKSKEMFLYDHEGNVLDENEISQEIELCWGPIYRQSENKILEIWDDRSKLSYENEFENNLHNVTGKYISGISLFSGNIEYNYCEINIPSDLTEHFDMALPDLPRNLANMTYPIISYKEVETQLKKVKCGKAPGPDSMKPELFKYLLNNENLIVKLTHILNVIIETQIFPGEWKTSNTILVPKKSRPKPNDLRPIALTNISYKILMGIIKSKIEKHLNENDAINDFQSGATTGRRVTENIFILAYCIEKSFCTKKSLFVLTIDFAKAFDSVDRCMMISALKNLNIHPKIINLVAKVYSGDKATMIFNRNKCCEIEITSGIRQGCNLSALLFVLITYEIINSIHKLNLGYKDEKFSISSLFYMDDGLILTNNMQNMHQIIFRIQNICLKYGLKLNKNKCKIMIFNSDENFTDINDIAVVDNFKYLGVTINNKKKCYEHHKTKIKSESFKFSNILYSILGNSVNRLLIGKTFWKGVILPNLLYANDIIPMNNSDLNEIQVIENKAFRTILQVPKSTANSFLRGEVGSSTVKSRDMKNKLLFLKHSLQTGKNSLLKEIIESELIKCSTNWMKNVNKYLLELNMNASEIRTISINALKNKIYDYDDKCWREEMENKSTLYFYKNKKDINEIKWFRNSFKYSIMMRARSNTLDLAWRDWSLNASKNCKLCDGEIETLKHFLLECPALQIYRNEYTCLQLPRNMDENSIITEILLLSNEYDFTPIYCIDMIFYIWKKRKEILDKS